MLSLGALRIRVPQKRVRDAFKLALRASLSSTASSSQSASSPPRGFYTPEHTKVFERCIELHASIMPLNEKVRVWGSCKFGQ